MRLVLDSSPRCTVADVASELGMVPETMRNWVVATGNRQVSIAADGLDDAERAELAALRHGVWVLKEEKEIAGRTAQFFARETNR